MDAGMQNVSCKRGLKNMSSLLDCTKYQRDLLYHYRWDASKSQTLPTQAAEAQLQSIPLTL